MNLAEIYRGLHIPRDSTAGPSGRNEASNIVALQIDRTQLRWPYAAERRHGIALVHESANDATACDACVAEDLSYAFAEDSCVRAIVSDTLGGEDHVRWQLLPQLGRVVELDEEAGTYKIVFFE